MEYPLPATEDPEEDSVVLIKAMETDTTYNDRWIVCMCFFKSHHKIENTTFMYDRSMPAMILL